MQPSSHLHLTRGQDELPFMISLRWKLAPTAKISFASLLSLKFEISKEVFCSPKRIIFGTELLDAQRGISLIWQCPENLFPDPIGALIKVCAWKTGSQENIQQVDTSFRGGQRNSFTNLLQVVGASERKSHFMTVFWLGVEVWMGDYRMLLLLLY